MWDMDIPDYNVNVKVYNVDAMQMTLEIKEHLPIGKCLWCCVCCTYLMSFGCGCVMCKLCEMMNEVKS